MPPFLEETHATLPSRDQDSAHSQPLMQLPPGFKQRILIFNVQTSRLDGFQVIRRQDGDTLIVSNVRYLGIDNHRNLVAIGKIGHVRHQARCDNPFRVVGDHDGRG